MMFYTDAEKEAYAKEEQAEHEKQLEYEQWAEEDFDDEPILTPLEGLIIDTRGQEKRADDIESMNAPHARPMRLTAIENLGVNRYIGGSNFSGEKHRRG